MAQNLLVPCLSTVQVRLRCSPHSGTGLVELEVEGPLVVVVGLLVEAIELGRQGRDGLFHFQGSVSGHCTLLAAVDHAHLVSLTLLHPACWMTLSASSPVSGKLKNFFKLFLVVVGVPLHHDIVGFDGDGHPVDRAMLSLVLRDDDALTWTRVWNRLKYISILYS